MGAAKDLKHFLGRLREFSFLTDLEDDGRSVMDSSLNQRADRRGRVAYRLHLLDSVPFRRSLVLIQEAGCPRKGALRASTASSRWYIGGPAIGIRGRREMRRPSGICWCEGKVIASRESAKQ